MELTDDARARITQMMVQVIIELAGDADGLQEAIDGVCSICKVEMRCSDDEATEKFVGIVEPLVDEDWELTVWKVGQSYAFKTEIGTTHACLSGPGRWYDTVAAAVN